MNEDEIKKLVFQLLKQIAPDTEPSTLQADENIREVLDIDSFDSLQFLVSLNQKLGIEIPEEDYGKITTVKTLVNYILDKIKHKGKCL
jgi:acyl carrier protein